MNTLMMKRLSTVLVLASAMALSACNKKEETPPQTDNLKEQAQKMDGKKASNTGEKPNVQAVTVEKPFIRASHPGQKVSAAFFTLNNSSDKDVEVTEVSSNVAKVTEFHTMEMDGGNMVMRKMEKAVIPANGKMLLSPGADHVMLIDLKNPLKAGDDVTITMKLSNGESIELNAKAEAMKMEGGHEHKHGEEKPSTSKTHDEMAEHKHNDAK